MAGRKVLRFMENEISTRTENEAARSVILVIPKHIHRADLLAALRFRFPCGGHQWTANLLGDRQYLVSAPDQWRDQALEKVFVVLGYVKVNVLTYIRHCRRGQASVRAWVKVYNLPLGLCSKEALAYLVFDFVTLVDCDIPSFLRGDI